MSMHSVLNWASICLNHCSNAARHGGDHTVALLRCNGRPGCFDSGLPIICIVGSGVFPSSSWQRPILWFGSCGLNFAGTETPRSLNRFLVPLPLRRTLSNMDSVPLHFVQTLGPWFPNDMQNWLLSEKRTLDLWAPVQVFFPSPGKTLLTSSPGWEWLDLKNGDICRKFIGVIGA